MSRRGLPMSSVESTRTAHSALQVMLAHQVMLAYLQICRCEHASFHPLYTDLIVPTLIDIKSCWRIKSSRLAHQVCVESFAKEHGVTNSLRASRRAHQVCREYAVKRATHTEESMPSVQSHVCISNVCREYAISVDSIKSVKRARLKMEACVRPTEDVL